MISGLRRGLALAAILALGFGISSQAGEKHIVIPEVVDAIDLNTGAPYYAPPVPQGHYTKDTYGHIAGTVHGALAKAKGLVKSICSLCGGSGQCVGCGNAAGTGGLGTCGGCGGTGYTMTDPNAHAGHNHGAAGAGVPVVAANGGSGHGLFSGLHGNGGASAPGHATFGGGSNGAGVAAAPAPVSYSGSYGGHGKASAQAAPSAQAGGSPQSACANGGCGGNACGDPACHGLFGRKGGRGGAGGAGNGCGTPGCTNPGCGLGGLFAGHGNGNGNGAGFGHGGGAGCGNPGCSTCGNNGAGHGGAGHPGMGAGHPGLGSKLAGLFHKGPKYKWFMGPGGPVPLTPGYVPYVNPVRSPRDFFAFPPYLDQAMEPGYASMPKSTAGFATDKATTPTDFVAPAAKPVVPPPAPRTEPTTRSTGTVPPPAPRTTTAPADNAAEKEDK